MLANDLEVEVSIIIFFSDHVYLFHLPRMYRRVVSLNLIFMKNVLLFFVLTSTVIGAAVMMKPIQPSSLHGNVQSAKEPVWVAKIDLFDSTDQLIASTLSDKNGNFSFDSVPSGTFFIEVYHASYQKKRIEKFTLTEGATKKITVELNPLEIAQERNEANRETYRGESPSSPSKRKAAVRGEAMMAPEMEMSDGEFSSFESDLKPGTSAGTLTSGEINDYSKWVLWEDLTQNSFDAYQKQWGFYLKNRYPVQVTFENGLPAVDVEVRLVSNKNEVVFLARTDNTGKAELWADMVPEIKDRMARNYKALVRYKGVDFPFPKLDVFSKGMNTLRIQGSCETSNMVDVAFVVDATGSMGDEIDYLKTELADVIARVKDQNQGIQLRTASVFYRDHGDQYVTRTNDFSPTIANTLDFIKNQYAAGGGDFPEAVDEALDAALNRLSWSPEARGRILFLVLDAPPHQADSVVKRLHQLVYKAAAMGVRIVPITASGINKDVEFLMRSMALATNGTYVFLTDHSGVGNKHLAPSTDAYDVKKLNDLMVELINRYATVMDCNQSMVELPKQDTTQAPVQVPIDSANLHFEELKLTCFPVPCLGPITFNVSHAGGIVYLYDTNGKLVMRFDMNERTKFSTNLGQLASGYYFVRYEWKGKWVSEKIVVQNS